jgi:hypothetical protein
MDPVMLFSMEQIAPGHVETVRRVLIDVLTPDQRTAIADGLGAVAQRLIQR